MGLTNTILPETLRQRARKASKFRVKGLEFYGFRVGGLIVDCGAEPR